MPRPDTIWIECETCEGSGREIVTYSATWNEPAGYDYGRNRCDVCDGVGEVEIEVEPIDLFDLEEIAAEIQEAEKQKGAGLIVPAPFP
jgi:hypothetical protein